jgi:putative ABC transport system substrate-binding protein
MDRRAFVVAISTILGLPLIALGAESTRLPTIGYLGNASPSASNTPVEAFRARLRALGWVDGQNVTIEYRWMEGEPERLPALLGDLVRQRVDVIFLSGFAAMTAAQRLTADIPIVFVTLTDPVATGFVKSLAHPGTNMTGLASQFEELISKQLQLLKEATPDLTKVALLDYDGNPLSVRRAAEKAAQSLGLVPHVQVVSAPTEFENAFKAARKTRAGAIHVLPSAFFNAQRARLIALAAKYRLPACYEFGLYVRDGGLMSYGPNIDEMFGRAATYVDRILKGANPGDLPIERPTRFELVVNLKTAAALGLRIPQSLVQRADEVIQ